MSVVIAPRRTTTAGKVPTTSDLFDGELGVNIPDGKIYVRNGSSVSLVGESASGKYDTSEATQLGLRSSGIPPTVGNMATSIGIDEPRFGRFINTTSNAPAVWGSYVHMPYDDSSGSTLAASATTNGIYWSRNGGAWMELYHSVNLPSTSITYTAPQTFNGGVSFGSSVASSVTDISRHIALWGSLYGVNVTGNRMNAVIPTGASFRVVVNGSDAGYIDAAGVHDASGNVRKLKFTTSNAATTLNTSHLNGAVEKSNNSSYSYTIASGLGTQGDAITIVNSGTAGNITITRAAGVALYRNGVDANITVGPGSIVTIYRSATANRWIA